MAISSTQVAGKSLLLYDGVCGLCNRFVQFVLRRDGRDHFRFLALQDPLAAEILARHGLDASEMNSVCLVSFPLTRDERVVVRTDAVVAVLMELGGLSRFLAHFLRILPRPLRDLGYRLVARVRYRIFGRLDSCPLPSVAQQRRFLSSQSTRPS